MAVSLRGIREDRERQAVLLRELLVRLDVVDADAEDLRVGVAEGEDVVAELAGLGRAARRLVLGIEVQRDPLAAIVLQLVPFAVLVLQLEFRRGRAERPALRRRQRRCQPGEQERRAADNGDCVCDSWSSPMLKMRAVASKSGSRHCAILILTH